MLQLDRYPDVKGIRDIDGAWSTPRHVLGGQAVSLDLIEHNLLRPLFQDPRIHAVVNCGARSCPPLRSEAFHGTTIDAQLEDQLRRWLNEGGGAQVDGETLVLSRIFDWYGADFIHEGWRGAARTLPLAVARSRARRSPTSCGATTERRACGSRLRLDAERRGARQAATRHRLTGATRAGPRRAASRAA